VKTIKEVISNVNIVEVVGDTSLPVSAIVSDSRKALKDMMFVAVKGTQTDGHNYIPKVIEQGCVIIVVEQIPQVINEGIVYIQVNNTSEALGQISSNFYNNPSEKLKLVAITGTNGKTTCATLLFNLFTKLGHSCGLLSTVQNQINEQIIPATHTTPDAISLNKLLADMVDAGCEYVFMEASSHSIEQNRIAGLTITGAAFTNITQDHLDYHHTFDNYIKAKKKLFDNLDIDAFALYNKDDRNGSIMVQNTKAAKYSFALNAPADFKAKIIECDFNGLLLNIDGEEAWYRLVGRFNAYNILTVYAVAFLLGKSKEEIITALSNLGSVTGRFDYFMSPKKLMAIIDYAHTPDALQNVLQTINDIRSRNETLYTIIGCGGNRDAGKRPMMAKVAAEMSDKVIFTSDNPRDENPETIIDQMQVGVSALHYKKTLRIVDRREAIKTAVSMANPMDIILLAGKGHETYQEIAGVKHEFDDKKIIIELIEKLEK